MACFPEAARPLVLAGVTALGGCSNDVTGGGVDANAMTTEGGTRDADASRDSPAVEAGDAGGGDGGGSDGGGSDDASNAAHLPPACRAGAANGGSRWQDLYACYFGPTGIANCSLQSSCHGPGGGTGTWECTPTVSSQGCYAGMISWGIVPDGGTDAATTTQLYTALRTSDGFGGTMPLVPTDVSFTPEDMQRIQMWIQSGAPNN